MNREIKFRGLHPINKEFIYGDLIHDNPTFSRIQLVGGKQIIHDVLAKTVGQYTGLKDKNGKEIYEGDMLKYESDFKKKIKNNKRVASPSYKIIAIHFKNGCFTSSIIKQKNSFFGNIPSDPEPIFHKDFKGYEVVGNIHQQKNK